jgi:hypothetical protein
VRSAGWGLFLGCAVLGCAEEPGEKARPELLRGPVHLGTAGEPLWEEFAHDPPLGKRLDLPFTAHSNAAEHTLLIRQDFVRSPWGVFLNDQKLGTLEVQENALWIALALPAWALREGENRLSIAPTVEKEDILVGPVRIEPRSREEVLSACALEVELKDADTRRALPGRITVVDDQGALAAVLERPGQSLAVRPGVIYTGSGRAGFTLPPGEYTIYGSRGPEYGVDRQRFRISPGQTQHRTLEIRREVPTPGWVSCDTHLHTLEVSRHGDCSLKERAITLSGEGVELAIATEHDRHASYEEAALETGVWGSFTPLRGCEITTAVGHFNIFPVPPEAALPDPSQKDWPSLLRSIRATPGVRVVILNHPRSLHSQFVPMGDRNFNPVTGESRRGWEFSFDAMELLNSGALRSDWMEVYRDWFALLNAGHRITGVGSSDSHTVNFRIVGQARTYVGCRDDDPGRIDPDEACEAILKGRALVSLGVLTEMRVNDRFGVGDLATGLGSDLRVRVTVSGPSWAHADRVELYANGVRIREERLKTASGGIQRAEVEWTLPRPANDTYLVAIASGPGVREPFWPLPRPYQPTSRVFEPRVIGSTNPIWLDADGDGKFTPPRGVAADAVRQWGGDPERLILELSKYDEAVAAQAAGLLGAQGTDPGRVPLNQASDAVRRGFSSYRAHAP